MFSSRKIRREFLVLDLSISILSNTQTVNEETTFTKSAATLIPGAMGPVEREVFVKFSLIQRILRILHAR